MSNHQKVKKLLHTLKTFAEHRFTHLDVVDSTNDRLKVTLADDNFVPQVLLANFQTSGRGQFKRQWFGQKKRCLMFSFSATASEVDFPLSLKAGIAAYMGINSVGVARENIWLKWPNDIWSGQRKLGGILSESNYVNQCLRYVIGMGINLRPQHLDAINHEVADILSLGVDLGAIDLMMAILAAWNELRNFSAAQLCQKWTECAADFWHISYALEAKDQERFPVKPLRLCQDGSLVVEIEKKEISLRSGRLIPVFK